MRKFSSDETLSELQITASIENQAATEFTGFNFDVRIHYDFEQAERGCQTRSNGDPGWPSIPAQAYLNRVVLLGDTAFSSGDPDEDDFISKTLSAGTDILEFMDKKSIRRWEDQLAEELQEVC